MTGSALLLAADHSDPETAAREARRWLPEDDPSDDRLVAAVEAAGFSRERARDAVSSLDRGTAPTRSCASGVESYVSDD